MDSRGLDVVVDSAEAGYEISKTSDETTSRSVGSDGMPHCTPGFPSVSKNAASSSRSHIGDPPLLKKLLPSCTDVKAPTKLPEKANLPVDVLLLTAEECGFLACYNELKHPYRCYFVELGYVYFSDVADSQQEVKVALLSCYKNDTGPAGSLISVKNAATVLKPKAVIYVGSCKGLVSGKSKLGDVLVSAKLAMFDQEQATSMKVYVSKHFLNLIKNCGYGWQAPLENLAEAQQVQVYTDAEFLTGPEQVCAEWGCDQLAKTNLREIAIETGGQGVFTAAFDCEIEWLIVKGIADYADGAQVASESWLSFASAMAASLVAHILSDPIVFQSWHHYEDLTAKRQSESMAKKQIQELEQVKSGIENLNEKLETLQTTVSKDEDLEQMKSGIKNLSEQLKVLKTTVPKDEEKNKDDFGVIKSGIEKLSQKLDTLWTSLPNVEDPLTKRPPSASDKKELRDSSCLEEFQKQLRSIYETINKVKIVPWDQSSSLHIDKVYTQLSWLRDEKSPSGMTQEKIEHYTDIFDGGRFHRTPKRILVHGRPGIGKTVFTKKATFDWSQHKFKGKLGRFDLVLLVKLRDICDLQDVPAILRVTKLLASDGLVSTDDLYDYVRRHQEKVLLILDGYDEYVYAAKNQSPVREIWEKKQLRDCCVVITSRDMQGEGLKNGSDVQFQIDGFDRDRQEEFARRFLKGDQDVEEFFKYLKQQELEDVAKIPLLLLMLCLVWKEKDGGGLPSSKAMIYFQFIQTLFNHMASKENGDAMSFTDVNEYKEKLCEIGELAFYALLQDSLYFPVNKLPNHILTTTLIKAGLFQVLNMSALNPCKAVHFIHKSLQEYLASMFLNEELSSQKDKNNSLFKVDSVEKILKMTEVFKFAVELSEEAAREIVVHLTGMAAKKDGLTEYSFHNESPTEGNLSAEQRNYLNLCTKSLFCCSADARKELFPTFLSSLGGVLVINRKQLNVTVTENLLKTSAPLMYIFFSYSNEYTEQDYRNLITLTQQLNAVIVSCSGEMKASEFLKKYPWRSLNEFFLKKECTKTYVYFSQIVKSRQNDFPFQMINALISLVEATNITKINPGGESSEQACSTHALCRVWGIVADDVNRSEVELLSDVFPFVLAPQVIGIDGEDDAEFDSDITKKILSDINPTNKLKVLRLRRLNVRSSAAGFIATILNQSPNLELLDLSGNPLLAGEGVDAISKHLRSTPHLQYLLLWGVKMTKEQVQQLTEEVMKHSSRTHWVTDYHDLRGNLLPEQVWPSESNNEMEQDDNGNPDFQYEWSSEGDYNWDSSTDNELEQDEGRIIELEDHTSSFESKKNEKDGEGNSEPEDEGSSAKSDDLQKQFQTRLATELHVKPEQVSSSSTSLDTRPSFREAPPFTFQVPASFPAGGIDQAPRKTGKRKKHEAYRRTEGDEESSSKTKKKRKDEAHLATEGDEESSSKTKKKRKDEAHLATEARPISVGAPFPSAHSSSHHTAPFSGYTFPYSHTHHHSAPSTIFTPGGSLGSDFYRGSGSGLPTHAQDERNLGFLSVDECFTEMQQRITLPSLHLAPSRVQDPVTVRSVPVPRCPTAGPISVGAPFPSAHSSSHHTAPFSGYTFPYSHTHHHSAPSTIFTPGGTLGSDSYRGSGSGLPTHAQNERNLGFLSVDEETRPQSVIQAELEFQQLSGYECVAEMQQRITRPSTHLAPSLVQDPVTARSVSVPPLYSAGSQSSAGAAITPGHGPSQYMAPTGGHPFRYEHIPYQSSSFTMISGPYHGGMFTVTQPPGITGFGSPYATQRTPQPVPPQSITPAASYPSGIGMSANNHPSGFPGRFCPYETLRPPHHELQLPHAIPGNTPLGGLHVSYPVTHVPGFLHSPGIPRLPPAPSFQSGSPSGSQYVHVHSLSTEPDPRP